MMPKSEANQTDPKHGGLLASADTEYSAILELSNLIEGTSEHFNERFWSKVEIGENDECWEWSAAQHEFGYGAFRVGSKAKKTACNAKSHRIAWMLFNGPIPKNRHVLHHCDNPPCCNPSHLFLGNDLVNQIDRTRKGRGNTGSNHPMAILNEEQVSKIKSRLFTNEVQQRIAEEFGISPQALSSIKFGRTWKHVPWPIGQEQSY